MDSSLHLVPGRLQSAHCSWEVLEEGRSRMGKRQRIISPYSLRSVCVCVCVCVCECVCGAREVCPRLSCRDTLKITVLPTLKFVDSLSAFIFLSFFLIFVLSFS